MLQVLSSLVIVSSLLAQDNPADLAGTRLAARRKGMLSFPGLGNGDCNLAAGFNKMFGIHSSTFKLKLGC